MSVSEEDTRTKGLAWLYLISATLRYLGLLVVVLAGVRYGLTMMQASLPQETVASIDLAWLRGSAPCIASDLKVFTLLHQQRLKGLSEEQILREHALQCEGATTAGSNVTLVLTWNDQAMKEHKTAVLVSSATADKLIQSGQLQRNAVRVRYSPSNPGGTLVLMEEIEASWRESLILLAGGGIAVLLGIVGGLVFRAQWRGAGAR